MCRYEFAIVIVFHWSDQVWTKKLSQILNISFIQHHISYITQLKGIASSSFLFFFLFFSFFFFFTPSQPAELYQGEKSITKFMVFFSNLITRLKYWPNDTFCRPHIRVSAAWEIVRHLCCETWLARWLNWEGLIYSSCSTLTLYCLVVSHV